MSKKGIFCSDIKGIEAKCEDLPERMPFMNHLEKWCNSQTEKGICFLCGKRFKAKRNPCKCGTESCVAEAHKSKTRIRKRHLKHNQPQEDWRLRNELQEGDRSEKTAIF